MCQFDDLLGIVTVWVCGARYGWQISKRKERDPVREQHRAVSESRERLVRIRAVLTLVLKIRSRHQIADANAHLYRHSSDGHTSSQIIFSTNPSRSDPGCRRFEGRLEAESS